MEKQHSRLKYKNAKLLMLTQLTELWNMIVSLRIAIIHSSSYCIFVAAANISKTYWHY